MTEPWSCPDPVATLDHEETVTDAPAVPRGVRVSYLRECAAAGCAACRAACERLADHLAGRAVDGEHRDVTSFQEADA